MNKLPFICFKNGGMSLYWNAFFLNYLQEEPIRGFKVCEYLEFMVLLEQSYRAVVLTGMKNVCIPVEWEASCVLMLPTSFSSTVLYNRLTEHMDWPCFHADQTAQCNTASRWGCMRDESLAVKDQETEIRVQFHETNHQHAVSVCKRGHVCSVTITTHHIVLLGGIQPFRHGWLKSILQMSDISASNMVLTEWSSWYFAEAQPWKAKISWEHFTNLNWNGTWPEPLVSDTAVLFSFRGSHFFSNSTVRLAWCNTQRRESCKVIFAFKWYLKKTGGVKRGLYPKMIDDVRRKQQILSKRY